MNQNGINRHLSLHIDNELHLYPLVLAIRISSHYLVTFPLTQIARGVLVVVH